MIHTDARYFVPSPAEEDEDSESEEEEEEEKDKEECVEEYKYKVVDGRTLFEASDEASEGRDFTGVLSPPPNRGSSAGPDSSVDPWSAGVDPWICASTAGSSSRFAEKYRVAATPTDAQGFAERFRSPSASTLSAAATRVLFESPASESGSVSPPPDPAGLPMRPVKHVSTSLPVAEAKRLRFLPPCACDFPPGIPTVAQVQSCSTQTCSSDHLTQISSVSEEGPSHLPDDGWAETQKQAIEVGSSIFGVQSFGSQVCQVEDF